MRRVMVYLMVLWGAWGAMASTFSHSFQVSVSLAMSSYVSYTGEVLEQPIHGTQNVRVAILDATTNTPLWENQEPQYINHGQLSVIVQDDTIDWDTVFDQRSVFFRIELLDDAVDIPIDHLPYAILANRSDRARQFQDTTLIDIDYEQPRVAIHQATFNAMLAVSGSIHADGLVGDASNVTNLTGPGFSNGYALNSNDGRHKHVVMASRDGNMGVHVTTPQARFHVHGDAVFQSKMVSMSAPSYTIPKGPVLLWDPDRAAFRSVISKASFDSNRMGVASMGFGEDIAVMADKASILGGKDHVIQRNANAAMIMGGADHVIHSPHSAIVGGSNSTLTGNANVVMGGRKHRVRGAYNVVLGGESHRIDGEFNTVIGTNNKITANATTVWGSEHRVEADGAVALGAGTTITHKNTMVYAASVTAESISPESTTANQLVVMAKNGLGINTAPSDTMALDVSGNVKAQMLVGDGQNLTNIMSGQEHWGQRFESGRRVGIYYSGGPVAIGTDSSMATLTVDGGITIQDTAQKDSIQSGTIRYTTADGLQLYHNNDWVALDDQDNNTILTAGQGVTLNNGTFSLQSLEASPHMALYFNGTTWGGVDRRYWSMSSWGPWVKESLQLTQNNPPVPGLAPLVIESISEGTETPYPLVVGGSNSVAASPKDQKWLLNVNLSTASPTIFHPSFYTTSLQSHGATLGMDNGVFHIQQSMSPSNIGDPVTLTSVVQVSPTSTYTTLVPRATLDTDGSVGFRSTVLDATAHSGISHKTTPDQPYLFFNERNDLIVRSSQDQSISLGTGARWNQDGEFMIGTANNSARAKVSIFGGGLALNAKGGRMMSRPVGGNQSQITSVAPDHLRMQFTGDHIMAFKSNQWGIGTDTPKSTVWLASNSDAWIQVTSSTAATLTFRHSSTATHSMEVTSDGFQWRRHGEAHPFISMGPNQQLGILTEAPTENFKQIHMNGSLVLSNEHSFQWLGHAPEDPRLAMKKKNDTLVFHLMDDTGTWELQSQNNPADSARVSSAGLAIHTDNTHNDALVVSGNARLLGPLYYLDGAQKTRIRPFSVKGNANNEFIGGVDSAKTWVIDDTSGMVMTTDGTSMTLSSPGYYTTWIETPQNNGVARESKGHIGPAGANDRVKWLGGAGMAVKYDSTTHAIIIENTLMTRGGDIQGNITINGDVSLDHIVGDASNVTGIPYYWQQDSSTKALTYSQGNVGIGTKTPSHDLHVVGTLSGNDMTITHALITPTLNMTGDSKITADQVAFIMDANNTSETAAMSFGSDTEPLMAMIEDDTGMKYGLFNHSPDAYFHAINRSDSGIMLLKSLSQGISGWVFSAGTKSAVMQLNPNINPSIGRMDDGVVSADRDIIFSPGGTQSLIIHDDGVAIGPQKTNNALQVNDTMVIGTQYDSMTLDSNTGLMVQNTVSVGHLNALSTGATMFSQDSLLVGNGLTPSNNFRGIMVSGNVGVGVQNPVSRLSVWGDVSVTPKLTSYSGDSTLFEWTSNSFSVKQPTSGIMIRGAKALNMRVGDKSVMGIRGRTVQLGDTLPSDSGSDPSQLIIVGTTNDTTSTELHVDAKTSLPTLRFESDSHVSTVALGADGSIAMDRGDDDVSDLLIKNGVVGINTNTPNHPLDVDGTVKADTLMEGNTRLYPLPLGAIVMWGGAKNDIPNGFVLCDGTTAYNGKAVPNLTNRFIKGGVTDATGTTPAFGNIGYTGGANTGTVNSGAHDHAGGGHTHQVNGGGHSHDVTISHSSFNDGNPTHSATPPATQTTIRGPNGTISYTQPKNHAHTIPTNHNHDATIVADNGSHHTQQRPGNHTHGGGSHNHTWDNEPEYYVLAFIIKVADTSN